MEKHINYLDLFSGLGAFAKGLLEAGFTFRNHYFSEIDKHAIANYRYNFKKSIYAGDINKIEIGKIIRPDIVTFGSPCQDLSINGKRRGLKGQKSGLFFKAIEIINKFRPGVFIFENVSGLFSSNKGKDFEIVLQAIADLGVYECQWQLINTTWFLPQNRERIYLVGCLGEESGRQIFPLKVPYEKGKVFQNKINITGQIGVSQTGRIWDGKRFSPTLMCDDGFANGYLDDGKHIRRLTPIEGERLQGLPDNWTKTGIFDNEIKLIPDCHRYRLIGNSISRPIATEIGKLILGSQSTTRKIVQTSQCAQMSCCSEEIKIVKRFVLLHGKVKNAHQVQLFISALQKAITEKKIQKTSRFATEIQEIQDSLIRLFTRFRKNEAVKILISKERRAHFLEITQRV